LPQNKGANSAEASGRAAKHCLFLNYFLILQSKRLWKIPNLPEPFHFSPISFLPLTLLLIGRRFVLRMTRYRQTNTAIALKGFHEQF
jgi:hypothetical protein